MLLTLSIFLERDRLLKRKTTLKGKKLEILVMKRLLQVRDLSSESVKALKVRG